MMFTYSTFLKYHPWTGLNILQCHKHVGSFLLSSLCLPGMLMSISPPTNSTHSPESPPWSLGPYWAHWLLLSFISRAHGLLNFYISCPHLQWGSLGSRGHIFHCPCIPVPNAKKRKGKERVGREGKMDKERVSRGGDKIRWSPRNL